MLNVHIAIDCDPFLILWFFDSRGEVTHVYLFNHARSDYQSRWCFSTRSSKQGLGWCICRWMDRIRDEINGRDMGPRDQTFCPCLCPYTSVSVYFFLWKKFLAPHIELWRHYMTAVQNTITPQKNPGLNGMFTFLFVIFSIQKKYH